MHWWVMEGDILVNVFCPALAQMLHCGNSGQRPEKKDPEDTWCSNNVHLQSQVSDHFTLR